MIRFTHPSIGLGILLPVLGLAAPAAAQDPDIRDLRPVVMLLVDSSGSMNYELGSASGPTGSFPTCTNTAGMGDTQSRWITLVETLTGGYDDYACEAVDRRSAYVGEADAFYAHPSFEPRGTQRTDGILDLYVDRVKFGLMTLDSVYGFTSPPFATSWSYLPPPADFAARPTDVAGAYGGYSYGPTRTVSFPGCGSPFSVNAGARREWMTGDAFGGHLISVGADSTLAAHRVVNQEIQDAIIDTRPFGGSAMDALLDDFREYLENDPDVAPLSAAGGAGDPYAACRTRYAVLISEGEIDTLYRSMGCDTAGYSCPYPLPTDTANTLCQWNGTSCEGMLDGLFVVGYDVSNSAAASLLDDIASEGGTTEAYEATDQASLIASLASAIDRAAPGTTTRTTPATVSSASLYAESTLPQQQFLFTSGFNVGSLGAPWSGVLDRTRYTCTGSTTPPERQDIDATIDSFHTILNARDLATSPRTLYTVVPTDPNAREGVLLANASAAPSGVDTSTGSLPREDGVLLSDFSPANTAVTPALLGISTGDTTIDADRRDAVLDWVHGVTGSARDGNRFGDIYHSSPVVVTAPHTDLADESFNAFRRRPEVALRPSVLYVGTNDGVLHAFAVEEHSIPTVRDFTPGEEIWGFVPPMVLDRLEAGMSAHQFLVDATPVVHDVYFNRVAGDTPSGNDYHTVLVSGLRAGGAAYFALDVTDPLNPSFLWQFRREDMGDTFGRPTLAQVYVDIGGDLMRRAVAILPGGAGEIDAVAAAAAGADGCVPPVAASPASPPADTGARTNRQCWLGDRGRSLYVVDVASGEVLRQFGPSEIPSPLPGGVSAFTGDVATIATRAYTVDADGVMWRLDMSRRNPTDWTFLPIHDLYWNDDGADGSTSTDPPIISTDAQGRVVVIAGTSDLDDFESMRPYRIASLTDVVTYGPMGEPVYATSLNWDIHLADGEQVTGPLELFDSRVYFGTFAAATDPLDACAFGSSQIWGVHYLNQQATAPGSYVTPSGHFPQPGLESMPGSNTFDVHYVDAGTNVIAMGVAVTRAPSCVTVDSVPDPYLSMRTTIEATSGGEFMLTAQLSGPGGMPVAGGSRVPTLSRTLPTPAVVTRVTGWMGNADY